MPTAPVSHALPWEVWCLWADAMRAGLRAALNFCPRCGAAYGARHLRCEPRTTIIVLPEVF
jgi:hypothetical protein